MAERERDCLPQKEICPREILRCFRDSSLRSGVLLRAYPKNDIRKDLEILHCAQMCC